MVTDLKENRSARFFDRLTRRAALLGGAASIAALATRRVTAQDATPVATPEPAATPSASTPVSLLFVQYAGLTTLVPGEGDVHLLTMTGVQPQTTYFSDRPNRIAGAEPTATFVDKFAESFADSAPNASLIGHLERGGVQEEAVVLTLLSAAYDEAAATLTYEVTLLDAELITDVAFEQEPLSVLDAPREYAEVSLFIDDIFSDIADGSAFGVVFVERQCLATGASPCGTQSTNCCDATCASEGRTSLYATEKLCAPTSNPDLVQAQWDCRCSV